MSHLFLSEHGHRAARWPIVREGIEKIKAHATDGTTAEHALACLARGQWDLFLIWHGEAPVGFLCCWVGAYEDGQLYVMCPYFYSRSGHFRGVLRACYQDLRLYAIIHRCTRIVFKTDRPARAFARMLGEQGFTMQYSELMAWT